SIGSRHERRHDAELPVDGIARGATERATKLDVGRTATIAQGKLVVAGDGPVALREIAESAPRYVGVAIAPGERFARAELGVHEIRAIWLLARYSRQRRRPVELLSRAEGMLALELRTVDG